jgi:hypothetical protein
MTIRSRIPPHTSPLGRHGREVAASISDQNKGKIHQLFERSFDCMEITSQHFFLQKLSYMHSNPCSGVWHLVENPVDYEHSSAKFYLSGEQANFFIKVE